MRCRVFIDTNILLSGIFFDGNESRILDMVELDLLTGEDVADELRMVVKKKLKYLKERTLEIALAETEKALTDILIIPRLVYRHKLHQAESLITHKKDIPVLAGVLHVQPDFFLTGNSHFFTAEVQSIVNVLTAKEFLSKIK